MYAQVFSGPHEYKKWINALRFPIEIISLLNVNGDIVLTYKQL
jgi:hypothetical protein